MTFALPLLAASTAFAAPPPEPPLRWAVLPVVAESPPPGDPTLARVTAAAFEVVRAAVSGPVRLASRAELWEHTAADGSCPAEIARLLGVDRVVCWRLERQFRELQVRIFERPSGLRQRGAVPCRWEEGAVRCEPEPLRALMAKHQPPRPFDRGRFDLALVKLRPRLEACFRSAGARSAGGAVHLRVRPDGRVQDVRIEPADLQEKPGYPCAARLVESLRLDRFAGAAPRRLSVPLPAAAVAR